MNQALVTIVIPTYWTWGRAQPDRPIQTIFDHPTPVDGNSTLPRLLESLTHLTALSSARPVRFRVLVLTAVVHAELASRAEAQVDILIAPFRQHYPIAQFGPNELQLVHDRLPALGFDPATVHLDNYAGVRNCQLLVPHILGAEIIVALDDDEVVAPDYLDLVLEWIGRRHNDQPVWGVAGFYQDADGGLLLPEGPPTGNRFLDKARIMNESTRKLLNTPGRLVPSPVAFGGNMVFHRRLFTCVGFDPGITRGEDLDYVLNARLAGFTFWLDKALRIIHLPPHHYDTLPYLKMAEDVRRFIYEREKLRLAARRGLPTPSLAELAPYPGRFLDDDLSEQARAALEALVTPELIAAHGSPEEIVAQAQDRARRLAPAYFRFAETWPRLMSAAAGDSLLRQRLSAHLA